MTGAPVPPAEAPILTVRIVMVGHVDHGKSTLIGRLLYEQGVLPDGRREQLQRVAQRRGTMFEWANVMDAFQAERDQNVTIDTAQVWMRTRHRQFVLIDAPGHEEFLKNMVTGASMADAALLLVDGHEGVKEQTLRHGYLLQLLGIRQLGVVVNKLDLDDFSQARFLEVERACHVFLESLGLVPQHVVPIVARDGDNLVSPSARLPWWHGPTVLEMIEAFRPAERPADLPLRFPIQDVYRFDERRILAGRVEAGRIAVGDRLLFSPSHAVAEVRSIERWPPTDRPWADAGESIGIVLSNPLFVERGNVASHERTPPYELTRFRARIFWMGRAALEMGRTYRLKLVTQEVECEVDGVERLIDASTLQVVADAGSGVSRHQVAELSLRTKRPVCFDAFSEVPVTGRFVIVDGYDVCGGGIVLDDEYPRRTAQTLHKSENLYWNRGRLTPKERAERNGHPGRVVWLTGLSGAGKSTIATEVERRLFDLGRQVSVLDGDNLRHGLGSDLGFSPTERQEHVRRVGEVAKLFADAGLIVLVALISPYRSDRELVRAMVPPGQFVEVYVNAPLDVCEQRDLKGLYVRARAGEIAAFTGISAPYEPPLSPDLELHTDRQSVPEAAITILEYLSRG